VCACGSGKDMPAVSSLNIDPVHIPKEDSVESVQCWDDIECPLTLQDQPGIIGGRRKQLIYRA
jgi:hypothetical protein